MKILTDDSLIECLDGIAYMVDRAGRIVTYGQHRWDTFASENDAAALCNVNNVLGRPLLDLVQGDDVREIYQALMNDLFERRRNSVSFCYHCDSPATKREMRMALTPIVTGSAVSGILFHSVQLRSDIRPPMDIFRFREPAGLSDDITCRPMVTICSYCQRLKDGDEPNSRPNWISAEEYYRGGGCSEVLISHGVCKDCYGEVLAC